AQLADGDAIRPGHDRALDELKDARDGGKRYIASLQARERERTGITSLKVGFNKVFGYYIEVTNPHKARVPPDYERRQTLTGAERYVTPELKEYEAKVLGAEERIAAREAELVDALRGAVALAIGRIQQTAGLLAQMGAFVPARRAVVGVVDRLFTRVGASDNLVAGQSTFMVEMSETSAILHGASARSLILLDEIGRGTSTYDGVAIAWAVTE